MLTITKQFHVFVVHLVLLHQKELLSITNDYTRAEIQYDIYIITTKDIEGFFIQDKKLAVLIIAFLENNELFTKYA